MYRIGLDVGSSYIKGVLVDPESLEIVDSVITRTDTDLRSATEQVIQKFSSAYPITYPIYSCGYGRKEVSAEVVCYSEIVALAKAVFAKYREQMVVIDVGGQDTKYIQLRGDGAIDSFKLNRKCAAGTGSFLEEIGARLNIDPLEFSSLAEKSTASIKLNSYCTVFAVTEIIGLIKNGADINEIAMGIYNSIAERTLELFPDTDCTLVLTGGVPKMHPMFVEVLRTKYAKVVTPEEAQLLAAYGNVLLSSNQI